MRLVIRSFRCVCTCSEASVDQLFDNVVTNNKDHHLLAMENHMEKKADNEREAQFKKRVIQEASAMLALLCKIQMPICQSGALTAVRRE